MDWVLLLFSFKISKQILAILKKKKTCPDWKQLVSDHLVLVCITCAVSREAISLIIPYCSIHLLLPLWYYYRALGLLALLSSPAQYIFIKESSSILLAMFVSPAASHNCWIHIAFNVFCTSLSHNVMATT